MLMFNCFWTILLLSYVASEKFFRNSILKVRADDLSSLLGYQQIEIRNSFKEAWNKFLMVSKGADEINSVTGEPIISWGGWGVTIIDSLDTLYVMNLTKEFNKAVAEVEKINFNQGKVSTSFFEVTIRILGGLISSYDLSGKKILLNKAIELTDILIKDFRSPSGFPYSEFNFTSQEPVISDEAFLANVGSCQLEFTRLSIITKNNTYRELALAVYDKLEKASTIRGEYYSTVFVSNVTFKNKELTFGAYSDSFFEYLLKLPIMVGKKDQKMSKYSQMFLDSLEVLQNKLIKPCFGNHLCLGRINKKGIFEAGTQHLEYFISGMLLLAGHQFNNQTLTNVGLRLLDSFISVLKLSKTGLPAEYISFSYYNPPTLSYPYNGLRPELVESLFYAYRLTKNSKYRFISWQIFKAFEKYSKTEYGYSEYNDVTNTTKAHQVNGHMPSFFFAETFKYLYLTFADHVLPLNQWVFNTEAHPFKVSS